MILEQRLAQLERKCRILILLLVVACGTVCLGAAGAPSPARSTTLDELVARRITLVDQSGRKRIVLVGDVNGDGCLALLDPAGNIRVSLSATKADSGILLFDTQRRNRVALNTDGGENAEVCLMDTANQQRMFLFTRASNARISLHGTERNPALTILNNGIQGLVGYGDITRDEGFIMAYNHQKSSGILKVADRRLVAAE